MCQPISVGQVIKVRVCFNDSWIYIFDLKNLVTTDIKGYGKRKMGYQQAVITQSMFQHYLAQGVDECLASAEIIREAILKVIEITVKMKSKTAFTKAQGIFHLG